MVVSPNKGRGRGDARKLVVRPSRTDGSFQKNKRSCSEQFFLFATTQTLCIRTYVIHVSVITACWPAESQQRQQQQHQSSSSSSYQETAPRSFARGPGTTSTADPRPAERCPNGEHSAPRSPRQARGLSPPSSWRTPRRSRRRGRSRNRSGPQREGPDLREEKGA